MKYCIKCKKKYADDLDFCCTCGNKLTAPRFNKLLVAAISICLIIIIVLIVFVSSIFSQIHSDKNDFDAVRQSVDNYKVQKSIEEYQNTPRISDLSIINWSRRTERNYEYIEGTVKNVSSSRTISYFEIGAAFYDYSGNIVDTDYTNDATDLLPGESRTFSIMHRINDENTTVEVKVQEVN